jgi:hypothetical protein
MYETIVDWLLHRIEESDSSSIISFQYFFVSVCESRRIVHGTIPLFIIEKELFSPIFFLFSSLARSLTAKERENTLQDTKTPKKTD